MHVILLHQYKLIADEQVDRLDVVPVILTTRYQAPASTLDTVYANNYHVFLVHCFGRLQQKNTGYLKPILPQPR